MFRRIVPFVSSSVASSEQQRASRPAALAGSSAQPSTPQTQRLNAIERASAPAKITDEMREAVDDDFRPIEDYDEPEENQGRSTQELLKIHAEGVAYMNKENRPVRNQRDSPVRPKRSVFDKQPNAERVAWSPPGDDPEPSQRKRRRGVVVQEDNDGEDEDDGLSEDGGFQNDERDIDPSRRNARKAAQQASKRVRYADNSDEREDSQQVRRGEEERLQASAMASDEGQESAPPSQRNPESGAEGDSTPEPTPAPFSQISEAARTQSAVARARAIAPKIQKRVPWSDRETERLIELIEQYGCKWSIILQEGKRRGVFAEHRDQVALKDKARNIKVSYLL